jgi:DNA-binding NtrC family response regulator
MKSILLVDDDPKSLQSYRRALRPLGQEIVLANSGRKAVQAARQRPFHLVITDLRMPDLDGLEVMRQIKALNADTGFIFLTGYGTVENAVEAMKLGADDYLLKPVDLFQLRTRVARILQMKELSEEVDSLRRQLDKRYGVESLVARSRAMEAIVDQITQVASTRATVLITGESGTGKELVARALHYSGARRRGPFIALNCTAFSEGVIENELFGHERGAFTGADSRQIGKFEQAHKGTLFLDEIGDLPPSVQVKLLRFLEEREFTRLGGSTLIKVDVRLVAATNTDLEQLVESGRFRRDLYYRLNVVRIRIPPLRERPEDIPPLVQRFLKRFVEENRRPIEGFTPAALELLQRYSWPGNVRELRNVVESLVVTQPGPWLDVDALPPEVRRSSSSGPELPVKIEEGASMEAMERALIERTLRATGGNRTRAAALLGIGLRTLQRKIKKYNLA